MRFQTPRFLGHVLLVPIALSGICFGWLLGIPMARAADIPLTHVMDAHVEYDHTIAVEVYGTAPTDMDCCAELRMEHGTDATVPHRKTQETMGEMFVAATLPHAAVQKHVTSSLMRSIPPDQPRLFHPLFLAKTLVKRE